MHPIDAAIVRTVLYADVFQYALTHDELHRYLITPVPVAPELLAEQLVNSAYLGNILHIADDFVTLADCAHYIEKRRIREDMAQEQWRVALSYGRLLARLPFVRMVALTGALAMRNPASPNDDFDYMLVTEKHRVWLARALAIIVVRYARLRGYIICPNYIVAEDALAQARCDIFIAHEIAQMVPVYGGALYEHFWRENPWLAAYLANAMPRLTSEPPPRQWPWRLLERILQTRLGDWLERWEYQRKSRRWQAKIQRDSAAEIDTQRVKGHFDDHGGPILRAYYERLSAYQLEEETLLVRTR